MSLLMVASNVWYGLNHLKPIHTQNASVFQFRLTITRTMLGLPAVFFDREKMGALPVVLYKATLFRCSPSFPWPCLADFIHQAHGMVITTRSHRNPISRQRTVDQVVFKRVGVLGWCWVYTGLYSKRTVEICFVII